MVSIRVLIMMDRRSPYWTAVYMRKDSVDHSLVLTIPISPWYKFTVANVK